MRKRPHVLLIPLPTQGHVDPLMKLAHRISDHGIKVTFVNSDFIHAKLLAAMQQEAETDASEAEEGRSLVRLVSIPDGMDPGDKRRDLLAVIDSLRRVMPDHLRGLIEKVNRSNEEDEQITCVVADITLRWWPIEVAEKMGIKAVPFSTFAPENLALALHIPKLIQAGVINCTDGSPLISDELISTSKDIPVLSTERLPWSCPSDLKMQARIFQFYLALIPFTRMISTPLLCNCVYELDSSTCQSIPNISPIGPLLPPNNRPGGRYSGKFWRQDSTCIRWLDRQPPRSVVYVSFGSIASLTQPQFDELAFALELSGRPFLWVVRSDGPTAEFPDGFTERVAGFGKIVSWAPQEEVLAHPSVACFLSHCGWNSTMDGVSMGVPFLCWPSFGEQFIDKGYICDRWKVGLGFNPDENGFISREEIMEKMEKLVSDDGTKANAKRLKEIAEKSGSEGGSSYNNFNAFIEAIKQC